MIRDNKYDDFIFDGCKTIKHCERHCSEVIKLSPKYALNDLDELFIIKCRKTICIINELEKSGWCEKMANLFIANNANLNESLITANAEYILLRHYLIKNEIEDEEQKREMIIKSSRFGIEDVDYQYNIKCLHKHYAHYVATGSNPIGKIVNLLVERYKNENGSKADEKCNCKYRGVEQSGSSLGS
jgi:hypothetical protein